MRLAFFVNDVATEVDEYTTTRLARAAAQGGHEVWYVGVGDVELGESDGQLVARAHTAEFQKDDTLESFMERIKERDAERIVMDDLDALFLRNESIDDLQARPWASPLGVVFGQMLKARGVTVVNDPMSLMRATSKLYLEEFPEKIRPRSLVTRDPEAIERFVGKLALDHIPLIQDLLDREVLQTPWIRPRWLDVPGAQERLDRLRAGASVTDLYEGDVS